MSINRVFILGIAAASPALKYSAEGEAIATTRVNTTAEWRDSKGEKHQSHESHKIAFPKSCAERASDEIKAGCVVDISGHIKTTKWKDSRTGRVHYHVLIVASDYAVQVEAPTKPPEPKSTPRSESIRQSAEYAMTARERAKRAMEGMSFDN